MAGVAGTEDTSLAGRAPKMEPCPSLDACRVAGRAWDWVDVQQGLGCRNASIAGRISYAAREGVRKGTPRIPLILPTSALPCMAQKLRSAPRDEDSEIDQGATL